MFRDRLLVCGGAGFVGSAFVRRALEASPPGRVLTFDLLTYAGHLENLEGLPDPSRHAFVEGDVADAAAVARVFRELSPTAVVNLAAESHVDQSLFEAARFVRTNVLGAQVLLDACREAGIRLVQVSTDEVYGDRDGRADATPDAPLAPSSPYSASKAAADLLVRAAFLSHGQDVVITRCTNNYGPRQLPEKLIPLFALRALAGEALPVYGDGAQVRDWIHVDDHAAGLLAALERAEAGSVHHFAGRSPRTNLDVARRILDRVGAPGARTEHVADRPAHDRRYGLDDGATRRALDWRPVVAPEPGLDQTLLWYRENAAWCRAVAGPGLRAFLERNYGSRGGPG